MKSKTIEASLALGDAIVSELQLQHDTLGRWMAQDLASKISEHKTAKGSRRQEFAKEIEALVFQFWAHRHTLPAGLRPFENYDAVLRALESLDPTSDRGRYFYAEAPENPLLKNSEEQKQWLDSARYFDKGARSIITMCISAAALAAGKPPEAWLKAASALAENDDLDYRIAVRFVSSAKEVDDEEIDLNEPERKRLERISAQLDAMVNASAIFKTYLDGKLKQVRDKHLIRRSELEKLAKSRKKRI